MLCDVVFVWLCLPQQLVSPNPGVPQQFIESCSCLSEKFGLACCDAYGYHISDINCMSFSPPDWASQPCRVATLEVNAQIMCVFLHDIQCAQVLKAYGIAELCIRLTR